jgi:Tol biopolymer transport system component
VIISAQSAEKQAIDSRYLGQSEPDCTPVIFAPGLVSVGNGVHGNIVFNSDFTEAAWHPNYAIDGKELIYIVKYKNGHWSAPQEFFISKGHNYAEPFYSYDNKRLLFLSGDIGPSGNAENERIFYVERIGDGWSEPKVLDVNLPAFHWQFSIDKENNLYFGGKSADRKGELYYSQYSKGAYLNPVRLPEAINSGFTEFSPVISPDKSYLVFVRMLELPDGPPKTNLFVSFRDDTGSWSQAQNLSDKLNLSNKSKIELTGAPRITPDGKFLFFCNFNGTGHMVYWVSTKIIDELRPDTH